MSLHNEELGIFDFCILQYVSKGVSFLSNVESLGIYHLHADTWQHDEVTKVSAAGVEELVPCQSLNAIYSDQIVETMTTDYIVD